MNATSVPLAKPVNSRPEAAPATGGSSQITVRFYHRMNPQKVYHLVVEGPKKGIVTGLSGKAEPLSVRPILAGTQILPAEGALDLTRDRASVVFAVTCLASGWLPNARVELLHQGQVVQEILLPIKGTTQAFTRKLALLTLLLPGLMLLARYFPPAITYTPGPKPEALAQPANDGEPARPGRLPAMQPLPMGGPTKEQVEKSKVASITDREGRAIARFLNDNLPHSGTDDADGASNDVTLKITDKIGSGYDTIMDLNRNHQLTFWVGCGLLFLTALSYLAHRPQRSRERGKPMILQAASVPRVASDV